MVLGLRRKPRFDPDTLSSIWVMACRDDSPVLTAFSVAYRLGGINPDQVMEIVKSRRELFRIGLTAGQSRAWKSRYRPGEEGAHEPPPGEDKQPPEEKDGDEAADEAGKPAAANKGADAGKREEPAPRPKPPLLDWVQAFDDEASEAEQARVRGWLHDDKIKSSREALDRFMDDRFSVEESAFRSQFRVDSELSSEPSDIQTVNWGLEHIERLRRGRAENRQAYVALFTGLSGIAIGAFVAVTAPMMNALYQGRPVDVARFTIDRQSFIQGYGTLGTAVARAQRAAQAGDGKALTEAATAVENATTALLLVLNPDARRELNDKQSRFLDACAAAGSAEANAAAPACREALAELQRLVDGPLAEATPR